MTVTWAKTPESPKVEPRDLLRMISNLEQNMVRVKDKVIVADCKETVAALFMELGKPLGEMRQPEPPFFVRGIPVRFCSHMKPGSWAILPGEIFEGPRL
jgi:hypothetical protein